MKKIMTLALAACMGLFATSCGEAGTSILSSLVGTGTALLTQSATTSSSNSTKSQLMAAGAGILSQMATNWVQNKASKQSGTKKEYTGTYTAQLLTYSASAKGYQNAGSPVTTNATTTLIIGKTSLGVTFPAITAGNAQMTQVSLTNLVANEKNVFGLSDNSTVTEGQLVYGGKTYDLANAYVELTATDTQCAYTASIYFNYDEKSQQYLQVMNVSFK